MDYKQLKHLLSQHEQEHPGTHLIACITFASFGSTAKKTIPGAAVPISFPVTTRHSSPARAAIPFMGDVWTALTPTSAWICL